MFRMIQDRLGEALLFTGITATHLAIQTNAAIEWAMLPAIGSLIYLLYIIGNGLRGKPILLFELLALPFLSVMMARSFLQHTRQRKRVGMVLLGCLAVTAYAYGLAHGRYWLLIGTSVWLIFLILINLFCEITDAMEGQDWEPSPSTNIRKEKEREKPEKKSESEQINH